VKVNVETETCKTTCKPCNYTWTKSSAYWCFICTTEDLKMISFGTDEKWYFESVFILLQT